MICSRCGKHVESYFKSERVADVYVKTSDGMKWARLDLCPECDVEVYKFATGGADLPVMKKKETEPGVVRQRRSFGGIVH